MIAKAVLLPDGNVDAVMLRAIYTWMSIDDLADVLELRAYHESWAVAQSANAKTAARG